MRGDVMMIKLPGVRIDSSTASLWTTRRSAVLLERDDPDA
jgi:hypothetical protein